jgi:hypothetical protein
MKSTPSASVADKNASGPLTSEQIDQILQRMAASPEGAQFIVIEMINNGRHAELMQLAEVIMRLEGLGDAGIQTVFRTADLFQAANPVTDFESAFNCMLEALQRAAQQPGVRMLDDSLLPGYKPPKPS